MMTISENDMERTNEILIYQSDDGNIKVDVLLTDDTVWLTQKQIERLESIKELEQDIKKLKKK